MKKLVIAVIVLSFFGFGPLKSFFQSGTQNEGEETKSVPILEQVKDTSGSERKIETILIMDKEKVHNSLNEEPGLLLKYDKVRNKLEYGSILVPMGNPKTEINILKDAVQEKYEIEVDYCVLFDANNIGTVIDLFAPNGIEINKGSKRHSDAESQTLKGKDIILYLEQLEQNPSDISPMFMALKQEIMKDISAEKILSLAPQVLNETFKSVSTDLGKGKLMDLGLAMVMNPVNSIEQIEIVAVTQGNEFEEVNKMVVDEKIHIN